MAEFTTLARPYAKAAFAVAREEKNLQGWFEALGLAASVAAEEKVQKLIFSPTYSYEQKAQIFLELCGDKFDSKMQAFIRLLVENDRLSLILEISILFDQYKSNLEKTVEVDITSAFEITSELEKKLAETLTKKLEREVSLHTSIDKSLLGGALIRAGDTVIDGSVKGRLAKLAETMNVQ